MRDTEAGKAPYIVSDPEPENRKIDPSRPRAWGYEPEQDDKPLKPR